MMINIKKLEEKEVVFSSVKPTEKEDMEFSKFLNERKIKKSKQSKPKKIKA